MMTYTFQNIISDQLEVRAMAKVKVLHVPFVIPQEMTFKIFHIFGSHT